MNEQIFNDYYLKKLLAYYHWKIKKYLFLVTLTLMMSNFLLPLITIPTKINSGTNTLIDNIFTNHLHPDMKTGNL